MPRSRSVSACSAWTLRASSSIALMPSVKLPPECAALPVTRNAENTPPLRPVTTLPDTRPGSRVEHHAGPPRLGLDHRAAFRAADLLVAGEQADQRRRRAAKLREGGKHEAVHHQPRLHVGDARAVGDAVADGERAARHLAVGEHGVAMAHQHDVAAGIARRPVPRHRGAQAVAVLLLAQRFDRDALRRHEALHHCADRIDARLVVAAAVDVHHLAQQRDHGVLLGGEPGGDLGFSGGHTDLPSELEIEAPQGGPDQPVRAYRRA